MLPQPALRAVANQHMIYATLAAVAVVVLSTLARIRWAQDSARRALSAQNPKHWEWRLTCLLARLLMPSVLAVLLLLLISAAFDGPLATNRWAIGLAILTGVLGNHIDREIANGWRPFWQLCHDSLRAVLPTFPTGDHEPHGASQQDCQALEFNIWHTSLLSRETRDIALRRIFRSSPHPQSGSNSTKPKRGDLH